MDKNLALDAVYVTESAALAASMMVGRGDEKGADQVAVDAMRKALQTRSICGTVVIGEGERDEAPMLFVGEKVGCGGGPALDIAVDPLEGTSLTARGAPNALSVLAFASQGGFLKAPDVYMEKIAVGPQVPEKTIHLDAPIEDNLRALAKVKQAPLSALTVCILDRPRHADLIQRVRLQSCRIHLIPDGDISGVIATALPESGIDLYVGSGGAPEGVLAAAALRCLGGTFEARLLFRSAAEEERASACGLTDLKRLYTLQDLASSEDTLFCATGVTDGTLLKGVRHHKGVLQTSSLVICAATKTMRYIKTQHLHPAVRGGIL